MYYKDMNFNNKYLQCVCVFYHISDGLETIERF